VIDQQTTGYVSGPSKINLYVGNLSAATTAEELKQTFAAFGPVVSVDIMNDAAVHAGHIKTFAYIGMAGVDAGEAAIIGLNGKTLGGQVVSVISALRISARKSVKLTRVHRNHI
jgi:RNA recognition motif-containing protein